MSFSWRPAMIALLVLLLSFAISYALSLSHASKEMFQSSETFNVVYIYSNSCGYCTRFSPVYDQFMQTSIPNVNSMKFEKAEPGASQYMPYISAFPTILIFDGGKSNLVASKTGAMTLDQLNEFVKSSLS